MIQAGRHFAPLNRRDALSCAAVSVALLALGGCERRGGDVPFQSIDVSGADWGRDFRLQDADGRTVRISAAVASCCSSASPNAPTSARRPCRVQPR